MERWGNAVEKLSIGPDFAYTYIEDGTEAAKWFVFQCFTKKPTQHR